MATWDGLSKEYKEKLALWDVVVRKRIVPAIQNGQRTRVEVNIAEVVTNNIHSSYLTVLGKNLTHEEASIIVKIHNLGEGNGNS